LNSGGVDVEQARIESAAFSLVQIYARDREDCTSSKLSRYQYTTTTPPQLPLHPITGIMASSSSQRMIHQDYIARIRYSNALPPPPNPTKLLDIPNTGLSSGQYTTPGFASRLARDQPLNIEADAELGMPLDLVGMPGIFDGDESCK
jgi:hypothetical protein